MFQQAAEYRVSAFVKDPAITGHINQEGKDPEEYHTDFQPPVLLQDEIAKRVGQVNITTKLQAKEYDF